MRGDPAWALLLLRKPVLSWQLGREEPPPPPCTCVQTDMHSHTCLLGIHSQVRNKETWVGGTEETEPHRAPEVVNFNTPRKRLRATWQASEITGETPAPSLVPPAVCAQKSASRRRLRVEEAPLPERSLDVEPSLREGHAPALGHTANASRASHEPRFRDPRAKPHKPGVPNPHSVVPVHGLLGPGSHSRR